MIGVTHYATRRILGAALVLLALGAACGGKSTAGKAPDPAIVNFQSAVLVFQEQVVAAGIPDVDRDLAFCLGPADPAPVATPVPDPSGHSRARIPCPDAAARVVLVLPRYKEMVAGLDKLTPADIKEPRVKASLEALKKAHEARLQLYEDAATAAAKRDEPGLARLRSRYDEINALSDDFSKKLLALSQPPK